LSNNSFEIAGASAGLAASWTSARDVGAEDVAIFGVAGGRETPYEDFEYGWLFNELSKLIFALADVEQALFEGGTDDLESFEYSWMLPSTNPLGYIINYNQLSVTTLEADALEDYVFSPGVKSREDFEGGWDNNEDFITAFVSGDVSYAIFGVVAPEPLEDFEEEWNQTALPSPLVTTLALFDGGANAFEDFETWTSKMVF